MSLTLIYLYNFDKSEISPFVNLSRLTCWIIVFPQIKHRLRLFYGTINATKNLGEIRVLSKWVKSCEAIFRNNRKKYIDTFGRIILKICIQILECD
jgi:hypothetical protein